MGVFGGPQMGAVSLAVKIITNIYSSHEKEEFNTKLLDKISSIDNSLEVLSSEIVALGWDLSMEQLFTESDNAEARIDTAYNNHVKNWLENKCSKTEVHQTGPDKGYLKTGTNDGGAKIKEDGTSDLDFINSAIMGELHSTNPDNKKSWLFLAINEMQTSGDSGNQSASLLETSYRYFLKLVRLQLRGVLCLRAINSDKTLHYSYKVAKNIIQQGVLCQKVVNSFLNLEDFVWFGQNNASPNGGFMNITSLHCGDFSLAYQQGAGPNSQVSAGFQFNGPVTGNGQWGIQMAPAVLNEHGEISTSKWQNITNGGNSYFNVVQAPRTNSLSIANTPAIFGGNQVITGIQLLGQAHFTYAEPNSGIIRDQDTVLYLSVQYSNLGPLGDTLDVLNFYPPNTPTIPASQFISITQLSRLKAQIATSPITGVQFFPAGNQIILGMQTSLHQNAFAPNLINASPFVGIKNIVRNRFISFEGNNQSPQVKHNTLCRYSQSFSLSGLSKSPVYGDVVTITYADSFSQGELVLRGSDVNSSVTCETNDGTDACKWVLMDPGNLTNITSEVYDWSTVALKNSKSGAYLVYELGSPAFLITGPPTLDPTGTIINDTSYLWSFDLQEKAELGTYQFTGPSSYTFNLGFNVNGMPVASAAGESTDASLYPLVTAIGKNRYLIRSNVAPYDYLYYDVATGAFGTGYDIDSSYHFGIEMVGDICYVHSVGSAAGDQYLCLPSNKEGTNENILFGPKTTASSNLTLQKTPIYTANKHYVYSYAEEGYVLNLRDIGTPPFCAAWSETTRRTAVLTRISHNRYVIQSTVDSEGYLRYNVTTEQFEVSSYKDYDPSFQFTIDLKPDRNPNNLYQIATVIDPSIYLGMPIGKLIKGGTKETIRGVSSGDAMSLLKIVGLV